MGPSSMSSGRCKLYLCAFIWVLLYCSVESASNVTNGDDEGCPATQNIQCKDGVLLPAWITPGNDAGEGWVAVKAFVYFVDVYSFYRDCHHLRQIYGSYRIHYSARKR